MRASITNQSLDKPRLFSAGLVAEQNDSRTERLCLHEFEGCFIGIVEEPFSVSQNDRVDKEPILVDQIMLHQLIY